ncbi:hypothetical protein BKA65DRAFT_142735 [Rhexocercosporidium sp. MPI-PUGE-AT-0058]|nr:hypothetical protein BKA65DRAFT_142735 [Rhexocercosporidium sp. MPI-PUGE-AT-0058]
MRWTGPVKWPILSIIDFSPCPTRYVRLVSPIQRLQAARKYIHEVRCGCLVAKPYFDNRIVPTVIKGNPNRHSWDNPGTVDDLNSTSVPTPGSTPHPHFIGGVFDKFLEKPQFTHRSRPLPMNQDSPETSPTTPRHVSEVVSTVKGPISSIMRSSPEPVETQTRTEFTNGVDGGSYEEIEEEVYEQGPVPAPGQFDPRYWASYMARIRDQIRETNLQRELDRRPSPPQSYVEFLQNRAQVCNPGIFG